MSKRCRDYFAFVYYCINIYTINPSISYDNYGYFVNNAKYNVPSIKSHNVHIAVQINNSGIDVCIPDKQKGQGKIDMLPGT